MVRTVRTVRTVRRFAGTLVVACSVAACGDGSNAVPDFGGDCHQLGGPSALVAFDPASGAERWRRTIGDADNAVAIGSVVAATAWSGATMGIDIATGAVAWCTDLGRVEDDGAIIQPWFVAVDGVLATAASSGEIVAFDPDSGRELWRVPFDVIEGAHVVAGTHAFLIGDNVVDLTAVGTRLRALDPTTGRRLADAAPSIEALPFSGVSRAGAYTLTAVPVNTLIASTATGSVAATSAPTHSFPEQLIDLRVDDAGTTVWQQRVPGYTARIAGGVVLVEDQTGGTGSSKGGFDPMLTAYEIASGMRRWQLAGPASAATAIEVNGMLVTSFAHGAAAIDPGDGTIVWQIDHGSPGQGGRYSEPGGYQAIMASPGVPDVVVGMIVAQEPYRD